MKNILVKNLKVSLLAFSVISVVSCGGGGDDDDDDGFPSDFDLFEQTGTWRLTVVSQTKLDTALPDGSGGTVNIRNDVNLTGSIVSSIEVDGDNITITDCDADAPETVSLDDFKNQFEVNLAEGVLDEAFNCSDESTDYTKISNSNYRVEFTCDDVYSVTIDYIRLSSAAIFNFGNLAFTSAVNPDLNNSDGVCGGNIYVDVATIVTPQPNVLGTPDSTDITNAITISAPYDGNSIAIDFNFAETVVAGLTYNVGVPNNGVEVELNSITFGGGTVNNPGVVEATGGTVTIDTISAFSVSGSFDIDVGVDNVAGTFSYDIE